MRKLGIFLLLAMIAVPFAVYSQSAASTSTTSASTTAQREAEIRQVYDGWAKAFSAHDLDGIMSFYAPGDAVLSYDIAPPLEYKGNAAYRKDYADFLAMFDGPLTVEFRETHVVAGEDVGFIYTLERITGTMKGGSKMDMWLRATSGLRKINGKWLIVHDHVSVPTDFESGKSLVDLKP